jgi:hypothetical protein
MYRWEEGKIYISKQWVCSNTWQDIAKNVCCLVGDVKVEISQLVGGRRDDASSKFFKLSKNQSKR